MSSLDTAYGNYRRIGLAEPYTDPSDGLTKVRDSLVISPSSGAIYYRELDLGFPDVRDSVQALPQADGTLDQTQYTGARNVTMTGTIIADAFGSDPTIWGWDTAVGWNSMAWWITQLSSWASPARRFILYFRDDDGRDRFMHVRGDKFSCPSPMDQRSQTRDWQIQFVNPTGKIYSYDTSTSASFDGRTVVRIQQESDTLPGRVYPEPGPYDRNYPAPGIGTSSVLYQGSVPTGCVIKCYSGEGTMTEPRVAITGPDGVTMQVGISGITINAGYVVTFDTLNKTVTMNKEGDPTVTNMEQYLTAPLQWPTLRPGVNHQAAYVDARLKGYNKIDYIVATADASAYAEVLFWNADLS